MCRNDGVFQEARDPVMLDCDEHRIPGAVNYY